MEHPLEPVAGTWSELLPDDAEDDARAFFAMLDEGAVELWVRDDGSVYAYDAGGRATWVCWLDDV